MDLFAFRDEVVEKGLGFVNPPDNPPGPMFGLQTNISPFYTKADPKVIMEVLEIARRYGSAYSGEHRAILSLYAYKADLKKNGSVQWRRASLLNTTNMISMRDWLKKQGCNPEIFYH
jgi:hypothetical protein